jgi:hypothetical protein
LVIHPVKPFPGAAVLLAGLAEAGAGTKTGMRKTVPLGLRKTLVPQSLGLRPRQDIRTKALQLLARAAVDQLIILPIAIRKLYHIAKVLIFLLNL